MVSSLYQTTPAATAFLSSTLTLVVVRRHLAPSVQEPAVEGLSPPVEDVTQATAAPMDIDIVSVQDRAFTLSPLASRWTLVLHWSATSYPSSKA